MLATNELLTPTEAAVVANVSVRNVNRVIDEQILPKRFFHLKGGRWLKSDACAYVMFYFHAAPQLTAEARTRAIRSLVKTTKLHGGTTWVVKDDFITLNFDRFFAETVDRHAALLRARERVVEDPEILGGAPTLRGTRIPVHDIAAAAEAGASLSRLKAAYPTLDDEAIELATLWAEANPLRGRPRRPAAAGSSPDLLSERKVARRTRG